MPGRLPGGRSQVCACPGCDETVIQRDPGSPRLYHSRECRKKARELRHHSEAAGVAEPGPAATVLGHPLSASEDPADAQSPEAAEDPDGSEFWKPDDADADGFWDASPGPAPRGARSPGSHRSPASPLRARRFRVVAAAVALTAGFVVLGLFGSQSGPHQPLDASGAQPPAPGPVASQPPSSSAPARTRPGRTPHAPGRPPASASPTTSPPSTSAPPAPSPAPSQTSPLPSPRPSRPARPSPVPSTSSKKSRAPRSLVSFEHGTDGWGPFWGKISVFRTTQVAYNGSHSLLITTARSTYSAVGVDDAPVAHLRSGEKVTFRVYSNGENGTLQPFVQDDGYDEHWAGRVQLPSKRGWFTLTWTVPSVSSVHAIGLQLTNPGKSRLTIAIDALTWPGS